MTSFSPTELPGSGWEQTVVEFGMSRTAQFCGKGRNCDLETFGRVLLGQDNIGFRGLEDPEDLLADLTQASS